MFQNIIFDDGARATSDLQRLRKAGRTKGPAKNDVKSHLKLLEAKKNKMETKDELEQIKQKEKENGKRLCYKQKELRLEMTKNYFAKL